uniref:Uncharacterized protein n=1 Tax=Panagrolaimus sp. PS1159 TaxID=55785 RepID=A0AC35F6B4_9BILA
MFIRPVSNASFIALKTIQRQNQFRLLNASAVCLRDKNAMDQAKEGAQNLVEKAKETLQHAKEQMGASNIVDKASETIQHAKESVVNAAKSVSSGNLAEKASEAMGQAKEKVQNMASNISEKGVSGAASDAYQQVKDTAKHVKYSVMGDGTTPSAKGKSATYDPRGTQEHVEELIQVNKDHFREVDKKLGGTGESDVKGGFDPKTH